MQQIIPLHIPTPATPKDSFRHHLILVLLVLWAVLIAGVIADVGPDFDKIAPKVSLYGAAAYALFQLYDSLIKYSPRLAYLVYVLAVLEFGIVYFGIRDHWPALIHLVSHKDRQQLTKELIDEVRDSTTAFQLGIREEDKYNECEKVGMQTRNFQSGLFTNFFKREQIPAKDTLQYIASVDSALGNPISTACRQASQFARMMVELSLLIRRQHIEGIDDLFQTYHISPSAKATEVQDTLRVSKGLLRNYLIDIIQHTARPINEVRPPVYSPDGTQIIKLIFTTKQINYEKNIDTQ